MIRERGGVSPLSQLQSLFDVVETIIESDDYQGCIFVNVVMEFPLPTEPAHMLASKNKQAIELIVHQLAMEANADDAHTLARELCLIMEGAYVTRQITGCKQTIEIARGLASAAIASRCSPKDDGEPSRQSVKGEVTK